MCIRDSDHSDQKAAVQRADSLLFEHLAVHDLSLIHILNTVQREPRSTGRSANRPRLVPLTADVDDEIDLRVERARRVEAVSYTHLDVYKRQLFRNRFKRKTRRALYVCFHKDEIPSV